MNRKGHEPKHREIAYSEAQGGRLAPPYHVCTAAHCWRRTKREDEQAGAA